MFFLIQNRLVKGFLKNEEAKKLYDSILNNPTTQKMESIESLFRIHVRQIQLLSYFSKTLHFESQKFDKRIRRNNSVNQLILDKESSDGKSKIIDLIQDEDKNDILEFNYFVEFSELEKLFEDKLLYKIVSKLSLKQKNVLYAIFVNHMTESEIAQDLGVTKQAINKIKNLALKKIKLEYKAKSRGEVHV